MHDFILANMLFHAAAGTALMLLAAGSAARELHSRRQARIYTAVSQAQHSVIELPSRHAKRVTDLEMETDPGRHDIRVCA